MTNQNFNNKTKENFIRIAAKWENLQLEYLMVVRFVSFSIILTIIKFLN